MFTNLRLVYPYAFIICSIVLAIVVYVRLFYAGVLRYRYSLVGFFSAHNLMSKHIFLWLLYVIKFFYLMILVFLIGQLQWYDPDSCMPVHGVSMVLALDVSGSMQHADMNTHGLTRFDAAKQQAITFIDARPNDAFGLVLFGDEALSLVPVTMDHAMVKNVIDTLVMGQVHQDGTLIGYALLSAINRLKYSRSTTKVIILLTDGCPCGPDVDLEVPVEAAKKLGIKIYTIGIGSDKNELIKVNGLYLPKPALQMNLLVAIAKETGGQSFMARNDAEMKAIYSTIDQLERNEIEVPMYVRYEDYLYKGLAIIFILLLCEMIFSTFIWFSL